MADIEYESGHFMTGGKESEFASFAKKLKKNDIAN